VFYTGADYARPWDGRSSRVDNVALWQNGQQLANLGNLGGLPRGEGRVIAKDWVDCWIREPMYDTESRS